MYASPQAIDTRAEPSTIGCSKRDMVSLCQSQAQTRLGRPYRKGYSAPAIRARFGRGLGSSWCWSCDSLTVVGHQWLANAFTSCCGWQRCLIKLNVGGWLFLRGWAVSYDPKNHGLIGVSSEQGWFETSWISSNELITNQPLSTNCEPSR